MELKHLHIHVRDRTVAEQFYGQWFGLTVGRRGASLTFMNDEAKFDLALMDDPSPHALPSWFHFGFRLATAEAVASLHERMNVARVPIVKPLYKDESLVSYRCLDPDGHGVEVYWEAEDASLE
jgi:catechol-2,3-dioxygenase